MHHMGMPMSLPGQWQGTSPIIALALTPPPPQAGAGLAPTALVAPPGGYNVQHGICCNYPHPRTTGFLDCTPRARVHLGDFYTGEGKLRSANDLRVRLPQGNTIWTWLRQPYAVLRPLVGALAPQRQQAPKTWAPGPIRRATTTAVISRP